MRGNLAELYSLNWLLQDHNMGLVKQCVQAFFKRNIQKLTKVRTEIHMIYNC